MLFAHAVGPNAFSRLWIAFLGDKCCSAVQSGKI
jgi:hypothetical protein